MTHNQAPLRLHIGGVIPKSGWKIFNIEAGPHVDYVGNCIDLSRFETGSVDEIYLSNVLEHLSHRTEMLPALKEMSRVLKKDGNLYISVPNMDTICRLMISDELDTIQKYRLMVMIFGDQFNQSDFHKFGFTLPILVEVVAAAGFRIVWPMTEFGLFEDCSTLKMLGVQLMLNVKVSN